MRLPAGLRLFLASFTVSDVHSLSSLTSTMLIEEPSLSLPELDRAKPPRPELKLKAKTALVAAQVICMEGPEGGVGASVCGSVVPKDLRRVL